MALAYHVADIHLDEVRRLTSSSPPLLALLDPFYAALASSPPGNTVFFPRVLENVIDPVLASDERAEVKRAVVKMLFDTGARQDCGHAQRRKLYAAWKERGGEADDD